VGLAARLNGGIFDGLKKTIALWVIAAGFRMRRGTPTPIPDRRRRGRRAVFGRFRRRFRWHSPRVPLGIVTARKDRWLVPRFHSDRILLTCHPCDRIGDFRHRRHGRFSPRCRRICPGSSVTC
jgi:hypothetical protein